MTTTNDGSEVEPAEIDRDSTNLGRREAMRVALAGAAAAAAFVAPRVEGFSLAPDYAAAATCSTQTATLTTVNSRNVYCVACPADNYNCWGNDNGNCGCNTANVSGSVNAGGTVINASVTLRAGANSKTSCSGQVVCGGRCIPKGNSTIAVNGILSGQHFCNVNWAITPDASGGAPFNNNGSGEYAIRHSSNGTTNRSVTITLSCNCNLQP